MAWACIQRWCRPQPWPLHMPPCRGRVRVRCTCRSLGPCAAKGAGKRHGEPWVLDHGVTRVVCGVHSEDVLAAMAGEHVAVREVRGVRDKFTGAPRGFCFLHLFSISDAARVMQLLQARRSRLRACAAVGLGDV